MSTTTIRGIFSSESRIQIGYKYQLHVQGLPCFEPHSVVVEETVHKGVNDELLNVLQEKAVQLAQAAIEAKAGSAGKVIFSVAKVAIQRK